LLGQPCTECAAWELAELTGQACLTGASKQEMMDSRAKKEVSNRIDQLEDDLHIAESTGNSMVSASLAFEIAQLKTFKGANLTIHKRAQGMDSKSEATRKRICKSMSEAIAAIRTHHARLGAHLTNSIRTGNNCSYTPEAPIKWIVSYKSKLCDFNSSVAPA